jgi:hypothetical protein
MRPELGREAFARGRRLAKRPPDVQQSDEIFHGFCHWKYSQNLPSADQAFATPKGASIPNVPASGHPPVVRGPVEIRVDPRLANRVQRALFRR